MLDLKPNQDSELLPVFLDILRQRDEHRDLLWQAWYLLRHLPDPEGCNQSWLRDTARLLGVEWPEVVEAPEDGTVARLRNL